MKRVVGIDFTTSSVSLLGDAGFTLRLNKETAARGGFHEYVCRLSDTNNQFDGFALHVVQDEDVYLDYQQLEHFAPFISTHGAATPLVDHRNSVFQFSRALFFDDFKGSDLQTYFGLRKSFSLCAIELRCKSLEVFRSHATDAKTVRWQNQDTALLHLPPSSMDLLVLEG